MTFGPLGSRSNSWASFCSHRALGGIGNGRWIGNKTCIFATAVDPYPGAFSGQKIEKNHWNSRVIACTSKLNASYKYWLNYDELSKIAESVGFQSTNKVGIHDFCAVEASCPGYTFLLSTSQSRLIYFDWSRPTLTKKPGQQLWKILEFADHWWFRP